MALDMEQLIFDAKILAERLKDKESDADNLISQTQMLKKRVDAMKQYQDDLTELNEVARHRPRSVLIHEIAKENRLIRELQQENYDLRTSLEEYQSALEMIMTKYREQITRLVASSRSQNDSVPPDQSQEISALIDKVCEMAAVMQQAVNIDENVNTVDVNSLVEKLQQENHGLRDLLAISTTDLRRIIASQDDKEVQTLAGSPSDSSDFETTPNTSMLASGIIGAPSSAVVPRAGYSSQNGGVHISGNASEDAGHSHARNWDDGSLDDDKSDASDVTLEGDFNDEDQ